jgi:hypothetical protein
MSEYKGIPTVGPRGIQFRSRIEAQWAYLFEDFGWNWEYEPIDLNGYIPDFIITFPNNKQLLIEVKGTTNIWDEQIYTPHAEKIIKSGWRTNYLIVGASYKRGCGMDDWVNIGIGDCGQYMADHDRGIKQIEKGEIEGGEYCLVKNEDTNEWDIFGNDGLYVLDMNGIGYWKDYDRNGYKIFQQKWVHAKNKVQWKGGES